MKECIAYEPWAHGEAHFEFNKAFLTVLCNLYDSIVFYGERLHISLLQNSVDNSKISFIELKITDYEHIAGKITSFFIELKNILKIRKHANENDIFFTYGAAHTMLYAERLLKRNRCFYIQHGALEVIQKKLSPLKLNYYLSAALKGCPKNHRIIVLGESIKSNALKQMPFLAEKMFSLDHPFIPNPFDCRNSNIEKKNKILIGTIGVGSLEKGLPGLNELAKYLYTKNCSRIQLQHIGRILDCSIDKSLIDIPFNSSGLIPRELYLDAVKKLDFVLFLYPVDSYKLTASGAVFDAFQCEKPIIALQNDFFAYLFKKCNAIGYMCKNIDQIKDVLDGLENMNQSDYEAMCRASNQILHNFSPDVVAEQLRQIVFCEYASRRIKC